MMPSSPRGSARRWVLRAAWVAPLLAALAPALAQPMPNLGGAFRPQPVAAPAPAAAPAATTAAPGAGTDAAAPDSASRGLRIVVIGGTRTLASIDGRVVQVGDKVNGMRVARIHAQGVVLTGEAGAREELQVHPAAKKLPPNSTRVSPGARP